MNIQLIKIKRLFFSALLVAVVLLFASIMPILASAEGDNSSESETEEKTELLIERKREQLRKKRAELEKEREDRLKEREVEIEQRKESRELKLEAKKLEICEKREDKINQHIQSIAERVERHKAVFDKISDRVQVFYEDKGLELSTYEALVEDVEAKKLTVEEQIEAMETYTVEFDCSGEDPLGFAEEFKSSRDEVYTAMKNYKESIKNLISEIKPVAEQAEKDEQEEPSTDETANREED